MNPRNIRVLVVDDYKIMLRTLSTLLGQMGFIQIDEASSAEQALECLELQSYDLILSDGIMEGISGLDFLKIVRKKPKWNTIPFIMITSQNQTNHVMAARNAGVTAYIIKPFSANTLRAKIVSIFGPLEEKE